MANSDPSFLQNSGVLSDRDIKKAIDEGIIEIQYPEQDLQIQPSSIDLHLASTIMTFKRRSVKTAVIDLKEPVDNFVQLEEIDMNKGTIIHPHEFILGVTTEWVKLPKNLLANVEGKSSLGRLGLVIHATAGFIDPGFTGHITLEITNLTDMPMILYANMPIGQIRFSVLTSPAQNAYGSAILGSKKYKNTYSKNPKPIASQYWKNLVK